MLASTRCRRCLSSARNCEGDANSGSPNDRKREGCSVCPYDCSVCISTAHMQVSENMNSRQNSPTSSLGTRQLCADKYFQRWDPIAAAVVFSVSPAKCRHEFQSMYGKYSRVSAAVAAWGSTNGCSTFACRFFLLQLRPEVQRMLTDEFYPPLDSATEVSVRFLVCRGPSGVIGACRNRPQKLVLCRPLVS